MASRIVIERFEQTLGTVNRLFASSYDLYFELHTLIRRCLMAFDLVAALPRPPAKPHRNDIEKTYKYTPAVISRLRFGGLGRATAHQI